MTQSRESFEWFYRREFRLQRPRPNLAAPNQMARSLPRTNHRWNPSARDLVLWHEPDRRRLDRRRMVRRATGHNPEYKSSRWSNNHAGIDRLTKHRGTRQAAGPAEETASPSAGLPRLSPAAYSPRRRHCSAPHKRLLWYQQASSPVLSLRRTRASLTVRAVATPIPKPRGSRLSLNGLGQFVEHRLVASGHLLR